MKPIAVSDEELARLRKREVIAHDDPTACCTREGHKRELAKREAYEGRKGPDVPNARHWEARLEDGTGDAIHIECERWNDARTLARKLARGEEVVLCEVMDQAHWSSWWQLRWIGSSLDPRNAPRLIARRAWVGEGGPIDADEWQDLREVEVEPELEPELEPTDEIVVNGSAHP